MRVHNLAIVAATVLVAAAVVLPLRSADAAAETVNIWLTTTNDSAGRNVTRGLQQQAPISFAGTSAAANQTVTSTRTPSTSRSSAPARRSPTPRPG